MSRQLSADQYNEFLEIGRLIDEATFKRQRKRIYLADLEAILDMVVKGKDLFYIAEIKKSSKTLKSGIFQLKYYLFLIKIKKGIKAIGLIKIPKEKISKEVLVTEEDEDKIIDVLMEMERVLSQEVPPKVDIEVKRCKNCAHFEFCWS